MKGLIRRIDIFCYKHPNFGIKNLMLYIIIGNTLYYIISLMDSSGAFTLALAFNPGAVFRGGQVWRLISFVFIPQNLGMNRLLWFVIEMYFCYFVGNVLEASWGKAKFTIFYFCGVFFHILYGTVLWLFIPLPIIYISAFYLNMSLFFVFATLYPDTILRIFFIIPLKAKWIAWAEAAYFIYKILSGSFPYSLLPIIAIMNYLIFCGGWLFERMTPKNLKARKNQRDNVIKFKNAAREYNRKQAKMSYNHKCEVCGRTDKDFPDLEFRFCSRCGGYHCFCVDHINNHVHFRE